MRKAGSGSFKRNRSSLDDELAVDSMKNHGIRPILIPELDLDDRFGGCAESTWWVRIGGLGMGASSLKV